jgi:hypothetical protein
MSAFENDTFIGEQITEIINRVKPSIIIETGTFMGNTTKFFTKFNIPLVGIEKNEEFYQKTLETVGVCSHFQLLHGDSPTILDQNYEVLKNKKIFAYLDAHWGGGYTLERELEFMVKLLIKPVLAIHDFYNPNHPEYGFDCHDGHAYTYDFYKSYFDRIYNSNYNYYYNNKATGAKQGIIYLEPK